MLGKLIKYEILSGWKKFAALYGASLLASLLSLVSGKMAENGSRVTLLGRAEWLFDAVLVMLACAMAVMTVVFVVQGFYKSMLKDEGYLTHTLPMPEWQILAAKLIAGYLWFLALEAVLMLCAGIGSGEPLRWLELLEELREEELYGTFLLWWLPLAPLLLLAHVFVSFALGNLSNRHKLGMSLLAHFGISAAESAAVYFIAIIALMPHMPEVMAYSEGGVADAPVLSWINNMMIGMLIAAALMTIVELIVSERIFARKLNLE